MINAHNPALTVFGPEVLISGLVKHLSAFIEEKAGVSLVDRFFVIHDKGSITRFYDLTSSTAGGHWPLVVDLFDGRLCLASIWQGPAALKELQTLKGATHPCDSSATSIRGNFACDNPVCNLVHVSDSPELVKEELALLENRRVDAGTYAHFPTGWGAYRSKNSHSALFVFLELLEEIEQDLTGKVAIPEFSSSLTAAQTAVGWLEWIKSKYPRLQDVINAFMAGRFADVEALWPTNHRWSAWDRLLIECGCHSNPRWLKRLEIESSTEVPRCL